MSEFQIILIQRGIERIQTWASVLIGNCLLATQFYFYELVLHGLGYFPWSQLFSKSKILILFLQPCQFMKILSAPQSLLPKSTYNLKGIANSRYRLVSFDFSSDPYSVSVTLEHFDMSLKFSNTDFFFFNFSSFSILIERNCSMF